MKYALNDVIDGRFQVKGLCSDEGGDGTNSIRNGSTPTTEWRFSP